jgi:hypothetical protein
MCSILVGNEWLRLGGTGEGCRTLGATGLRRSHGVRFIAVRCGKEACLPVFFRPSLVVGSGDSLPAQGTRDLDVDQEIRKALCRGVTAGRKHQSMKMLGHEYERDEPEFLGDDCSILAASQVLAPAVVRQQRHSPIASERQFVEVPRFMIMFYRLPMWMMGA